MVFSVELGGGARFEVGPRAEKLFEAVEDVEEGRRNGEADRGDAELGTEFEELGNAVELKLELIQTHMIQKPMLRVEEEKSACVLGVLV